MDADQEYPLPSQIKIGVAPCKKGVRITPSPAPSKMDRDTPPPPPPLPKTGQESEYLLCVGGILLAVKQEDVSFIMHSETI